MRLTSPKLRLLLVTVLAFAFAGPNLRSQSGDKKLSVYSPQANYSVAVVDRDNQQYVGLVDLLEPLGRVDARGDNKWKLEFTPANATKSIDVEFQNNKRKAKVRGANLDLPANFVLAGGRGYVPLSSLANLLPRLLEMTVQLHEPARRLFIGNTALKLTPELRKNPSRLVLTFPTAVSPFIASENGNLRMVFTRDAVISPGTDAVTFADPLIASANFSENNGAAEFTIHGSSPLLATFGDNGRTITIAAAPQQAAAPPPPPSRPLVEIPQPTPTTPTPAAAHQFLVVIDAAHGGEDRGATLTDTLAEKDVTLALARRIHRELEIKGIAATLVRTGDYAVTFDQRAVLANSARADVFISIHADILGTGVRFYTALIPPAPPLKRGTLVRWDAAQASFLDSSSAVAGSVAAECNTRKIPVRAMAAAIRPLNSVAGPAIAIELAPPPAGTIDDITGEKYQQSVASAVAAGVLAVKPRLGGAR